MDTIDISYIVSDGPEFFMIGQCTSPTETMANEECEIIAALKIDGVDYSTGNGCYSQRADAEAVAAELIRRKPSRSLYIVSNREL